MRENLLLITLVILLFGCIRRENEKEELNHISFDISTDEMVDSLKIAMTLLDKMDNGNGASCSILNGKLRFTQKEIGFISKDISNTSSMTLTVIEPFDTANSKRLIDLIQFLNENGIHSMGKRYDGIFCFQYKQRELNASNDFKKSRVIVYIKEEKDTNSNFFNKTVILDRYKNLLLTAPEIYDEPKLAMDKESIMKRTEELMKKRQQKN